MTGRTLVVTNDFPTRRGGIETFVLSLCQRLEPGSVVVYTARMPGDAAYDATLPFPVVRDRARTLLPTPALARRVEAALLAHGCDRVVFGAAAPLALLASRLRAAGASRVVALTHGHEVWWARVPGARSLLRRIARNVDVLTYVSGWCRDQVAAALPPDDAARMRPLSPGVDPDRFHPGCGGAGVRERLGLADDVPVVVCTARLVARKGQDTLVRAWPEVLSHHPGARLLLVGDGPHRRRLERLVRRLGLRDRVLLVGSVPWTEMPAYTDAGDAFAMPCRTRRWGLEAEAFGIVFLEARACGLPVVAGDSGGVRDALGPEPWCTQTREPASTAAAVVAALALGRRSRLDAAAGVRTWGEVAATLRCYLEV